MLYDKAATKYFNDVHLLILMNAGIAVGDAGNDEYWLNELRSLGVEPHRMNELNDEKELLGLVDNIKRAFFEEYITAHSQ